MKNKYHNITYKRLVLPRQHSAAGFSLVELLVSIVITGILSVLVSFSLNFMLSSNQKLGKEENRRIEMSRALEAIANDIRMSQQVNKTAASATTQLASAAITASNTASAFSPALSLGTPVLYLEVPMGTGTSTFDRVIYHVKPSVSTDLWVGPQVLYRYGRVVDASGNVTATSVIRDVPIADGLISRAEPSCASPAVSSGLTAAAATTGFYACVNRDQAAVAIFGDLGGGNVYEAKETITARAAVP